MSALIEAAGWALLHSLWQGALLAGLVALALRQVDRRAATLRYGLACAALALLPLLAVGTAWHVYAPPPSSGESCCEAGVPALANVAASAPAVAPEEVAPALPSPAAPQGPGLVERLQVQVAAALPWLVLAWALGVSLSSLRLVRSHARLRRLVSEAQPAKPEWQARLTQLAERMGLSRPVALLETHGLDSPATLGWLVPVVLVPVSALAGLSPRQL
jgi:beta-lactamase regulating signal transducer with metallopeptidase domain